MWSGGSRVQLLKYAIVPLPICTIIAMAVSRTSFRNGDRVRGAEWFDEIAGAVGTVLMVHTVNGDEWVAQDLLVRFDRPVAYDDDGEGEQWTFCHLAHNFEHVDEARPPRSVRTALPIPMPKRRRLTHKQIPPAAYQARARDSRDSS